MTSPRLTLSGSNASDATRAIFAQYRTPLHRFLVRRLRSASDAQDVAQDVYLRFLQVAQHEPIREPQAFLYRLASNLVYEFHLRARRSLVDFDSATMDELKEQTPEDGADQLDERLSTERQLEQVLRQLPRTYQTVLLLRKRDGLTPDEIAQLLGLSKTTVYTYLIRAMAQFKTEFARLSQDGEP